MPLAGNIINKAGIGPLTLKDAYFLFTGVPGISECFWLAVTLISLTGSIILLWRVTTIIIDLSPKIFLHQLKQNELLTLFLLMIPLIYLPIFFINGFIDRYLFPPVPFLAAAILIQKTPVQLKPPVFCQWVAVLILAGFFIFSVAGTKDYLTWNRTRWTALNDLMKADSIKPSIIDGGFEFNGCYLYNPDYKVDPKKSDWWVGDDLYLISFSPLPAYAIQREYHYTHWLPPYTGSIYVLKRMP